MTDSISTFIAQLREALPYSAHVSRQVVREVHDHLMTSKEHWNSQALNEGAAEQRAVEQFGSIPELIAKFESEGGPVLASTPRRASALVAFLLALPAALFVTANVLKYEFQLSLLYNASVALVMDQATTSVLANILITLGPLAALVLAGRATVRFTTPPEGGGVRLAAIRLSWPHLLVALLSFALVLSLGAYLVLENSPHF